MPLLDRRQMDQAHQVGAGEQEHRVDVLPAPACAEMDVRDPAAGMTCAHCADNVTTVDRVARTNVR